MLIVEEEERLVQSVVDFVNAVMRGRKQPEDMSEVLTAMSEMRLTNIDRLEGAVRWGLSLAARNSQPSIWNMWRKSPKPVTWLDMCSGDGRRRERALRELTGPAPNSIFCALVIRRLNDWVRQVREAARECAPSILSSTPAERVAEVLSALLPHWSSWGRLGTEGKETFIDLMRSEGVSTSLYSIVIQSPVGPMSQVLAQAGRSDVLDGLMVDIAYKAVQPSVRAKAYRSILNGSITWISGTKWTWTDKRYGEGRFKPVVEERQLSIEYDFEKVLVQAIEDRSAMVRRVAAEILIEHHPKVERTALQLAEALANDADESVAERGKFALKYIPASNAE